MLSQLLPLFYNNTRSLEVLYLLNGLKDAVRLDASRQELEKISPFCKNENISMEISDFKLIKVQDRGKGGFSNTVQRVALNDARPGVFHLYLARKKETALELKKHESDDDDQKIGRVLGYPECCIEFFVENKRNQQQVQNDFILPALKNSAGISFPFFCNHAIRYFDVTLLSHFPHSFQCKESCQIASKRLQLIEKHSGELAAKFETLLKCAVLYTEREGVFLFRNHSMDKQTFSFENVLATADNQMLKQLLTLKELTIRDKNTIILGDKPIEDAGFMLFS